MPHNSLLQYSTGYKQPIYKFSFNLLSSLIFKLSPWCLGGKESDCDAGDAGEVGSIPGLGRSLEERNGNPLQYSCL